MNPTNNVTKSLRKKQLILLTTAIREGAKNLGGCLCIALPRLEKGRQGGKMLRSAPTFGELQDAIATMFPATCRRFMLGDAYRPDILKHPLQMYRWMPDTDSPIARGRSGRKTLRTSEKFLPQDPLESSREELDAADVALVRAKRPAAAAAPAPAAAAATTAVSSETSSVSGGSSDADDDGTVRTPWLNLFNEEGKVGGELGREQQQRAVKKKGKAGEHSSVSTVSAAAPMQVRKRTALAAPVLSQPPNAPAEGRSAQPPAPAPAAGAAAKQQAKKMPKQAKKMPSAKQQGERSSATMPRLRSASAKSADAAAASAAANKTDAASTVVPGSVAPVLDSYVDKVTPSSLSKKGAKKGKKKRDGRRRKSSQQKEETQLPAAKDIAMVDIGLGTTKDQCVCGGCSGCKQHGIGYISSAAVGCVAVALLSMLLRTPDAGGCTVIDSPIGSTSFIHGGVGVGGHWSNNASSSGDAEEEISQKLVVAGSCGSASSANGTLIASAHILRMELASSGAGGGAYEVDVSGMAVATRIAIGHLLCPTAARTSRGGGSNGDAAVFCHGHGYCNEYPLEVPTCTCICFRGWFGGECNGFVSNRWLSDLSAVAASDANVLPLAADERGIGAGGRSFGGGIQVDNEGLGGWGAIGVEGASIPRQ